MAAPKRQEWEIERDRQEIASLLARNRRILHKTVADILNRRRQEEFRAAAEEVARSLGPDDPIPVLPPPYTLTRQMVDYEVRALKRQWRKATNQDVKELINLQLNEIDELARAAWEGYERSMRTQNTLTETTTATEVDAVTMDELGVTPREIKLPATKTHKTREGKQLVGNPRYLEVVGQQIAARNELLGLTSSDLNVQILPTNVKLVAGFNPADWEKQQDGSPDSGPPEGPRADANDNGGL